MRSDERLDMHASVLLTCMAVSAVFGIISMFGILSDAITNHGRMMGHWVVTSFGVVPFCGLCFLSAHGASERLLMGAMLVDIVTAAATLFVSPFSLTPAGYLLILPAVAACAVAAFMHGRELWSQF